jgi:alpha-1,6-mannosyltransferase
VISNAAVTLSLDSLMWNHWIWPELHVLWFNSVLNRSSEWGVSFYKHKLKELPKLSFLCSGEFYVKNVSVAHAS